MAIDGIQTSADAGLVRGPSSSRLSTSGNVAGDRSKFLTSSRQLKAKSMQPPSNRKYLSPPSTTPDHSQSHSGATERTLGRLPQHGANTPSSSASKRTSVLQSPHATGLGARTISPTDARRLKRLSMLQDPPPIPATPPTPPTPQPDVTAAARWAAQSPSMIPRKSVTPSSTRTTPDLNRKSYSSGLSISSNTSYNSIRTSTGSLQPRPIQPNAASRLPTPKPRNVHSSAGVEEEVPPVPAIPKAYGSPRDASDPASFATRKSSLPPAVSNVDDTVTSDSPCLPSEDKSRSKADREFRQKRGLTIGAGSDLDGRVAVTPSASRKNLQPLRLPPLNLLPLSTPTVSKVAALQEHALDGDGRLTPPPRRTTARTPSTPMTASKTNFFSTSQSETEQTPSFPPARSSSSSHVPRTELGSKRVGSSSSSSGLGSDDFHLAQQTVAPSVPAFAMGSDKSQSFKGLGSVQRKQSLGQPAAEFTSEARALRLNGPRAQAPTKLVKAQQNTTSPEEPESASSGTSLRRKLSLSLRRASSKASQSSLGPDQDESPQSPRYNSMPPPKMPASATWTGSSVPSPSPSNKAITQTHARRKSSAASLTNGHDVRRTDAWNIMHSNGKVDRDVNPLPEPPDQMPPPSRTMSSILSPMHKILSSKTSLSTMKARSCDPTLDRDDMAAEEEMRKLASKRKDFEAAAKEVDDLRRRATPKERVTPAQALRRASLNIFERGEIIDYKEVFFCGTQNAKKHVGDLSSQGANFGYDDERGDYNIVNGDHLAYRYEIVDILGKGSFGQVVRCVDHKTGGLVAVKIIRNKKRFHQQALVEVNILQLLREWDPHNQHSMVNFTQSFYFRGHLCISTELLGINLYEFIKSNDFKGFTLKLIRRFTKQMLSSLVLLSGHRVIHCDLKPENILLAHPVHSEIKVIDFGSSCFENEKVYTYIQSRFYRSPEVILGTSYGMPIDMWSLGCILAELFTGYPIFPGENEQEQLACIMEVFGPPEKHLIEKSTRKKLFFDSMGKPRLTVSSKGRRRRPSSKTLQQALKCDDDAFLDFLTKCLRWDPERRMKPDEALEHEFITGTKKTTRARTQPYRAGDSPVKRFNSVQTPSTSRPLPEPPATSFKSGTAVRSRDLTAGSPSKVAPVTRRPSRVNGLGTAGALQRSSTGATLSSSLPRVAPRSASVKTELATAAASVAATSAQRR
ncbi:MAG: hypothetical protein M1817_006010 [Caeruleum heppii]|nr:MAG: hypothetical protein M1817_006010 [Caeruleum heppii]